MKQILIVVFLVILGHVSTCAPKTKRSFTESILWYKKPASHWLEALPLGNGSLGAMVYGGVDLERIQFNENSLVTGTTKDIGSYQPFGDLYLDWGIRDVKNYRRSLALDKAIHTTNYIFNGVQFFHEYFISKEDNVLVLKVSANHSKSINVKIQLKDSRNNLTKADSTHLYFKGILPNNLAYESAISYKQFGGNSTLNDSSIVVTNADSLICYLSAGTSFKKNAGEDFLGNLPHKMIMKDISKAKALSFEVLRNRHILDYTKLYSRVKLLLEGSFSDLPTDERLIAYSQCNNDFDFEKLVFQYGRYLLISSSRPNGLPANLQGLWNAEFKPAWYSQYTTNINVQMNYWLAEQTNLSECHMPLFDWVDNLARVNKASNDSLVHTRQGWLAYSTNNIMGGGSKWRLHKPGSAWLSQHYWEHYQFTGDLPFLKNRAYPLLKDVVSYWENHLILSPDGKFITPDGWSPEHGPNKNELDKRSYPGVSYDQQIVYDLFTNYIEASQKLNLDILYRKKIQRIRDSMLGPQIGKWGQLQEWMDDLDDSTDHHRHNSHLFAVHPGKQISFLRSPDLALAAKKSLISRGEISTGWSTAWRINLFARLLDGEQSYKLIKTLLSPAKPESKYGEKGGLYANLFDAHPPFQIDGNFGYTSGVSEMLLQSQNKIIHLLPALPIKWENGTIEGLKARQNIDVNIIWQNGRLVSFSLKPKFTGIYRIQYGDSIKKISLKAGVNYDFTSDFFTNI